MPRASLPWCLLVNLWTIVSFATAVAPSIHDAIQRISTPPVGALVMIGLWLATYAYVQPIAQEEISRGGLDRAPSSRLIVVYAVASVAVWFVSIGVLLATRS